MRDEGLLDFLPRERLLRLHEVLHLPFELELGFV
jgi:hypothetical protein